MFREGQKFYEGQYLWRIDHLIDVPATIQTILYFDKKMVGLWRFKPTALLNEIESFMSKKIEILVSKSIKWLRN